MRLTDLEPEFLKVNSSTSYGKVDALDEADGIMLDCPVCVADPKKAHKILCWRPRVATSGLTPGPGRWELQGTGFDDLTLVAGSSSVFLSSSPCKAHFFVRNGEIILV